MLLDKASDCWGTGQHEFPRLIFDVDFGPSPAPQLTVVYTLIPQCRDQHSRHFRDFEYYTRQTVSRGRNMLWSAGIWTETSTGKCQIQTTLVWSNSQESHIPFDLLFQTIGGRWKRWVQMKDDDIGLFEENKLPGKLFTK